MIQNDNGVYLPTQREKEFRAESLRRSLPWTMGDYKRLHLAVQAMVRTHVSWDRPGGELRPSFDGSAYWEVLGALDRTHSRDSE